MCGSAIRFCLVLGSNLVLNLVLLLDSTAKRIQNKAVVNETRSVEELGALLAKAESAFDMQQVFMLDVYKRQRYMSCLRRIISRATVDCYTLTFPSPSIYNHKSALGCKVVFLGCVPTMGWDLVYRALTSVSSRAYKPCTVLTGGLVIRGLGGKFSVGNMQQEFTTCCEAVS